MADLEGPLPDGMRSWNLLRFFQFEERICVNDECTCVIASGIPSLRPVVIPEAVGGWTSLRHLKLHGNLMHGSVPDSVQSWSSLRSFTIGDGGMSCIQAVETCMTGVLPDSIGSWKALLRLQMQKPGSLKGSIPEGAGHLALLESFALAYGPIGPRLYLEGSFPRGMQSWTHLRHFKLVSETFDGGFPDCIDSWTELETLYIHVVVPVSPKGTIPFAVSRISLLTTFVVLGSMLAGCLPDGPQLGGTSPNGAPNPMTLCKCNTRCEF